MQNSNTKTKDNSAPKRPELKRNAFLRNINLSDCDIENPPISVSDVYVQDGDDNLSVVNNPITMHVSANSLNAHDIEHQIEMTTPKSSSEATTASHSTSSNNSDEERLSVVVFPEVNDVIDVETSSSSIAKRIVKNHELRYMSCVPEKTDENLARFKYTSIITADGLYQINREFFEFRRILNIEELQEVAPVLTRQANITEPDGILTYDDLTLEQLNQLESTVRDHRGHSVIGYSINEEVFLKLIGLGQYEYPPEPDAYPKRVLNAVNMPIARDISASLRLATYSLILLKVFTNSYAQYDPENEESADEFYYKNVLWFLVFSSSVATLSLFFLRNNIFKKETVITSLNRSRLIEEAMIGAAENWTSYGSLALSQKVIGYGLIPVLMCAFKQGLDNKDESDTASVINIFNHTKLQTFWTGLSSASTTGSFFTLGLDYFVLNLVFAKDMDDDRGMVQVHQDLSRIQYAVCAASLLCHLARYPNASSSIQKFGRYSSNISNSMGFVMLDNYATFVIISMTLESIFGTVVSPKEIGIWTAYYSLQAITFIYSFLSSFPVTPDLPEFSNEFNSSYKSIPETCKEKMAKVRQVFLSLTQEKINDTSETKQSRTNGLVELSLFSGAQNITQLEHATNNTFSV